MDHVQKPTSIYTRYLSFYKRKVNHYVFCHGHSWNLNEKVNRREPWRSSLESEYCYKKSTKGKKTFTFVYLKLIPSFFPPVKSPLHFTKLQAEVKFHFRLGGNERSCPPFDDNCYLNISTT